MQLIAEQFGNDTFYFQSSAHSSHSSSNEEALYQRTGSFSRTGESFSSAAFWNHYSTQQGVW